jgi:hypothetical protein
MMATPFSKSCHAALAALGLSLAFAAAPAAAQEGLVMRNILGKIGLLPEEKEPIEYRERPGLVVPKELDKLRPPEPEGAHARNGQWPVDPDVKAREEEKRRREAATIIPNWRSRPEEGGRLSVKEMAAGRSHRGAQIGEAAMAPGNEKAGVRLSVQEMTADRNKSGAPTYAAGTEPPRQFLTDPPTGLRMPASSAPMRRQTAEPKTSDDDFRRPSAQRLD